jgi:hypothetical protein
MTRASWITRRSRKCERARLEVCKMERADYLALPRPGLAHQQPSVVDDSYVDPLPYQSEDACIAYPPLNHLHELFPHDGVEVGGDVQLKNTRNRLAPHGSVDLVQRVLCTTSGTEPVGAIQKILLIDGCEQLRHCLLHDLIFQGGHDRIELHFAAGILNFCTTIAIARTRQANHNSYKAIVLHVCHEQPA